MRRRCTRAVVGCVFVALMVMAAIVPACAGLIGGNFQVSGGGSCGFPDAAYNSVNDKYLVVWADYNYNPQRIFGRFVSNAGAVLGNPFQISDGSGYALYPAVAFNSTNNEFLVTWDGQQGDTCVGQRVRGSDGVLLGANFTIGQAYGGIRSAVAWSSVSNCYLAVYFSNTEVYARRVSGGGGALGSEINVSADSAWSGYPSVAYSPSVNQFLVTWDHSPDDNGYIEGQRIDAATGGFAGGKIAIARSCCDIRSTATYDTVNNRWLVQFNRGGIAGHSFDQWGQLVNANGTLYGGAIPIADSPLFEGDTLLRCDVAFAPGYGGRFFSAFILDAHIGGQELYGSGAKIGAQVIQGAYTGGSTSNTADTDLNRFLTVWCATESGWPIRAQLYEATASAPPSPVTNFVATPGSGQNVLTWKNPSEPTFTGTMIRFKTTGYPTSTTDGTLVVDKANSPGSNDSYTHSGLTNEVTYYYTAFSHSSSAYASGVNASATPSAIPGLLIIPKPQDLTWKAGTGFLINASTQIMANSSPDAREVNMAQQLQRKIWDTTGYLIGIVYGGSATSNVIAVGTPARCPAVNSIISTWSEASGKASKTEGYMLGVKDTSIVIRGFDDPGSFYGSQTLIQLLEHFRTTRISPLFCYDYPELAWRGTHFRMKFDHDVAFSKELFAEMFARYKMNRMLPELWMKSISHPEFPAPNDTPMQPADAQDFVNFCKLHYIVNIGGTNWGSAMAGSLNDTLKENPSLPQDDPLETWCQRHSGTRALREQLWMDEINLLSPQYMHTGQSEYRPHDPAYPLDIGYIGCPRCAGYSNQWLFSDYLWQDRTNLFANHGITPVIWGDMLKTETQWGNGGPTEWNTAGAVATMPSETIIFDWEYGTPSYTPTDYPSLDTWIANGKKAVGTPYGFGNHPEYGQYYGDIDNIYYWANAVYNRSLSYPQYMLGIVAFNKYNAYGKRETLDNPLYMDFLEPWPFYAEWGWNPNGRYWSPRPYIGKDMIRRELSPDIVSGFSATPSGSNVILAWTNPPDSSFTGAYIVYRTDRYPASPIDGTYLADVSGSPGASGNYTHVSAPASAYYAAFAHDNVRHFSPVAIARVGGYCFEDQFSYTNGALVGGGGWTGTATASHITIDSGYVKILGGSGSYDAIKTVSCGADGTGYITVICKINGEVGVETMWNLWIDDSSQRNLARWYGAGTTARGRIGTTAIVTNNQTLTGGWDTLKVRIHPANNTTEFFFNDVSLGTYSHSSTSAGDAVGRLRFERISNSNASGHYLYFDDLTIGTPPPPAPDTTPPGLVTNFTASPGDGQINLSWTNPGDADFAGTRIVFRTDGFPSNPTDGTLVYNGTGTSASHIGLTNGVTYYYSAFAYDEVPNYSSRATASGTPVSGFCFRDIFLYSIGALNGQGGWSGSAGASQIQAADERVYIYGGAGSYDSIHTMNCTDAGYGYIMVRLLAYRAEGCYNTSWSMWADDSSGRNFGRWYGAGTTARGRIGATATVTTVQNLTGNGSWDSLVMKIVPSANTTQFFFNGADLGTYSHAGEGTGDAVGRIRFERINNSGAAGEWIYLDDLRVGGS